MRNLEKQREWRRKNAAKCREYSANWRAKNPEKYQAALNKRKREHPHAQREAQRKCRANGGKERERDFYMRRLYGIGLAEYAVMLAAQGGTCAICNGVEPTGARFNVDHCHSTGRVRGLLCRKCNAAIGLLRDDPQLVTAALEYLKSYLQ